MKIDIQKIDDRIRKLQEIRRIAADSELANILLEFMSDEETVPEPVLARMDKTHDLVNDVVNGTGTEPEVRDGLWSRRR